MAASAPKRRASSAEARLRARAVLAKTTISDIVDRENQATSATMYYI